MLARCQFEKDRKTMAIHLNLIYNTFQLGWQCFLWNNALLLYNMYLRSAIFLAIVLMAAASFSSQNTAAVQRGPRIYSFQEFKQIFGKRYESSKYENVAKYYFQQNIAKIKAHNALTNTTYKKGVNQFSDSNHIQLSTILLSQQTIDIISYVFYRTVINPKVPIHYPPVDWAKQGKVTAVKNQGPKCGSCYSFASLGALESAILIAGQPQVDLSEQQVVDCTTNDYYRNRGCENGALPYTFEYMKDHGITTEDQYPYIQQQATCKPGIKGKFKIIEYESISGCEQLQKALQLNPISVLVESQNMFDYDSGIFDNCLNRHNHAVLLVGATDQYWNIKNSWGTKWGENGYIRIARGNTCGICEYPSYPIYK